MLAGRAVVTAASVARASAVSAFRAHDAFLSAAVVYQIKAGVLKLLSTHPPGPYHAANVNEM